MEHDCILELDTDEIDNGNLPKDLENALDSMYDIAMKKGKAVCIFTVYRSETESSMEDAE